MFELEYDFLPGAPVYVVIDGTRMEAGVVLNVKFDVYTVLNVQQESVVYKIKLNDANEEGTVDADADVVFGTLQEAADYVLSFLSPTPVITPTMTLTPTITPTVSPTISLTPTITPTMTPAQTVTPTLTPTPTITSTITPTITPTLTATLTVTPTPTLTQTVTPTPTVTPPFMAADGFAAAGRGAAFPFPTAISLTVDSFPFSNPFTVATDVGNLAQGSGGGVGNSSTTDGYQYGGVPLTTFVFQFPFASPFTNSTTAGTLAAPLSNSSTQQDTTDGYRGGGIGGATPALSSLIDRFPFSSPFTSFSGVGNLAAVKQNLGGHSSPTDGYASGGLQNDDVESFPFSTPFVTATNIGNLGTNRQNFASSYSPTDGYITGGSDDAPVFLSTISSFAFSTPFTTETTLGDLSTTKSQNMGISDVGGTGYSAGGQAPPSPGPLENNQIESFPFSTPFTIATDVGNLSIGRWGGAGLQG